jgi:integrase
MHRRLKRKKMNNDAQATFAEHAATYISRLEKRRRKPIKPTSVATFRSALRMATPVLGALPLRGIESENLKQLVERLSDAGFSPNTVRLVLRTTKKVIASAVDDRGNALITKSWNNEHIDQPSGVNRKSAELLTASQIETAIRDARPIIREFIETQAATGLRKGEMLALKVEDFDASARTLHVARTLSYFGETSPKTPSGAREVDLHPDIAKVLQRMLAGRTAGRLFDVSIDAVRHAFEKAGLKSHELRHFRYTHLQRAEIPNAIRDYWMGHASKGMERVYGHIAQDAELKKELAQKIGIGFSVEGL